MKKEARMELVNQPNHYCNYEIEPIAFCIANDLPFVVGNIVKYLMRYKFKNGMEDLLKAARYLELLITWEKSGLPGLIFALNESKDKRAAVDKKALEGFLSGDAFDPIGKEVSFEEMLYWARRGYEFRPVSRTNNMSPSAVYWLNTNNSEFNFIHDCDRKLGNYHSQLAGIHFKSGIDLDAKYVITSKHLSMNTGVESVEEA